MLSKTSVIQIFLYAVSAGKKQAKQVGMMAEIRKKFDSEVMTTHFLKNFGKIHKFWSLGLEFQVSSLGLGIFGEFSVSKVTVYQANRFKQRQTEKFLTCSERQVNHSYACQYGRTDVFHSKRASSAISENSALLLREQTK